MPNGKVSVPRAPDRQPEFIPPHDLSPDLALTNGLVLVVDDNPDYCLLLKDMIECLRFPVLTAAGESEALQILRQRGRQIRGVVLDLDAPSSGNDDTLRALRRIRGDVPILIASGSCLDEMKARFALCLRLEFLEKPFTLEMLEYKLQEALFNQPAGFWLNT